MSGAFAPYHSKDVVESAAAYPSSVRRIRYRPSMTALRFMSFNIRLGLSRDGPDRWYRRRDLVFGVIERLRPHVLGVQEAFRYQLEELLAAFPSFGVIADRRYGGRHTGTYAPLFFDAERLQAERSDDFWLAPDPDGHRGRGWDAAVPRIATWAVFADRQTSGRRFAVANSHFDQAGVVAREESARLLAERLGAVPGPRVILGDLNADESTRPLEILREAGYRDSFRIVRPDEEALTYHGFRGRGARTLGKIDYVLCDAGWRVVGAEIVRDGADGRYPSDHFPITAELDFSR